MTVVRRCCELGKTLQAPLLWGAAMSHLETAFFNPSNLFALPTREFASV